MGCYYYNFEVLKSRYDPGDQLKWLEDELAALEKVSGSAIVIGHIPPMYDECMHGWSVRYKALAERYQHVIRFGLFGHDHEERVQIVTAARNPNQRIGFNFMAGSATTFLRKNPSFNVIELDEATMLPVNIKTYYFNISNAAVDPKKPQWEYLHDYI